jgi:serine/threonine-protein kinase
MRNGYPVRYNGKYRKSFIAVSALPAERFSMIGKTISHYQITLKLGQGGMGEVFLAHDASLDRKVALKFLPDEFSGDSGRLARFKREAKILASLSHPNIAAIHGLEQADGKSFLVLELVEGETLAQRIARGQLPIEEALEVCRQIAEGLESAHEEGIVHRDLKPSNVKITPAGRVKILDFGLARAMQAQPESSDLSNSPTIPDDLSIPGVILGTAAYMSPEQAKGRSINKRTDIWAFGCVLFECLTGKRAFQGETVTEIVASILKSEPDWSSLPAELPASIRTLLRRCLQKDQSQRLRDIGDARIEILEPATQSSETETAWRRLPFLWLAVSAAVLLIVGVIIGPSLIGHFRKAPFVSAIKSTIQIGTGQVLAGTHFGRTAMALAHNGRFMVYGAPSGPVPVKIYLRWMDQLDAIPVSGTEKGMNPFLSPDDQWIGFWEAGGKLKKVPVTGGVPTILCDTGIMFGADWGRNNTIIFSPGENLGLSRISSDGGQPEVLTVPDKAKDEFGHRLPHYLPDNRGVLFTVGKAWDMHPRLALLDLKTRKWREVMKDAADGQYLPTGHLVFLRQGVLMAVAFDIDKLEVAGQPVPIIENVMQALNFVSATYNSAAGQYSVSESGWLAYVPGGIQPDKDNSLVHMDQDGSVQPAIDRMGPFASPRFSPDGRRIAYLTLGKEWLMWVYDLGRGTATRLLGEGQPVYVTWTPDGKRLVFGWNKTGEANLYWQPADGSSPMERLTVSEYTHSPGSFSPDGSTLAFVETRSNTNMDILLLDMKSRRVSPYLNSSALEGWPEISPNGRWLAYASNESGQMQVWVRPFPGPGGMWQISKEQGREPIWSKDGRRLYYRSLNQVWAVDVETEGSFSAGKPRLLFEKAGISGGMPIGNWDLWPDGRGFLAVQEDQSKQPFVTEMILIQNWFEELIRLVPIK